MEHAWQKNLDLAQQYSFSTYDAACLELARVAASSCACKPRRKFCCSLNTHPIRANKSFSGLQISAD